MDKKIKIISVATPDYHDYMLSFLLSFEMNCKSSKDLVCFKLYLINYSEDRKNEFSKIDLSIETVMESHSFKDKNDKSCFCTNYRYILLKRDFDHQNVVCWIDCDALFVKDCSGIFNTMVTNDNGLFLYEKNRVWKFRGGKYQTLMGGFIGVNATKEGEVFSNEYCMKVDKYIRKNKGKMNEWWANQHVLRMMIKEDPQSFKPYFFQEPLMNTVSNPDTHLFFKDEKKKDHKAFKSISDDIVKTFREKQ